MQSVKNFLSQSYHLIPHSKRKKLPVFFAYSFVNTVLDLISIVYLIPVCLVLLDKKKA